VRLRSRLYTGANELARRCGLRLMFPKVTRGDWQSLAPNPHSASVSPCARFLQQQDAPTVGESVVGAHGPFWGHAVSVEWSDDQHCAALGQMLSSTSGLLVSQSASLSS
jgi:hypothetical protein